MEEIWKDIKGYEGIYQVSNKGNVKSLKRIVKTWNAYKTLYDRLLKAYTSKNGYLHVVLRKDNVAKNYNVHRLVAEAFIPNTENKSQVNHIDEDKTNNCVYNLEWCTPKENINYGNSLKKRAYTQRITGCQINNKSTSKKIRCIQTNKVFPSIREACRTFNLDASTVSKVCKGKKRATKGWSFCYV